MRHFFLSILLRMLGYTAPDAVRNSSMKDIEDWLIMSYKHPGFHSYIANENLSLLKQGMNSVQTRDKYLELVGARVAIKKVVALAKDAHIRYIKDEVKKRPLKARNEQKEAESVERTFGLSV